MTAFDRQLAARAAAVSALAWVVAAGVVAATDEGAGWSARAGLISALAPVAAGIGAWVALGVATLRGEVRALGALGVPPARIGMAAAAGAAAPALAGASLVATPWLDLGALFPRALASEIWERDGADLVARTSGLRIAPGGAASWEELGPRLVTAFHVSRAPVAIALLAAAIAIPLATSSPRPGSRRLVALGAALVVAIASFQAVAAGRLAAAWLIAAPLALLCDAALAYRTARA